jgi:PIN like domain
VDTLPDSLRVSTATIDRDFCRSAERKATEGALQAAKELVGDLKRKVEVLQIDKHGLGLDPSPLIADLEQANNKLIQAIEAVHKQQPDVAASDMIRDQLDQILVNKIGPGPTNQAELDKLIDGGEQRYLDKIPPGYADSDKDKNPTQATFFHDHIKYQRKFGDLILWRQTISFVKTNNIKAVLLVTADRKEDWWWREQGKTIGVQPELVREIHKEGGVNLFWMYSSVQFLEHAKTYVKTKVSDQAVAELQEVSASPRRSVWRSTLNTPSAVMSDRIIRDVTSRIFERTDYQEMEKAVYDWLNELHGEVLRSDSFPDLIIPKEDDLYGYEIKFARNFERMLFTPPIINSILRGYLEVNEGRLAEFTMVVVVSMEDFYAIQNADKLPELQRRVAQLLRRYPIEGIVIGAVLSDGRFEPLLHVRSSEIL